MAADFKKIGGIALDKKGQLYISTRGGGLFLLNPANGQLNQYKHDPLNAGSLLCDTLLTAHPDRFGYVWISAKRGVDRFDPGKQSFT